MSMFGNELESIILSMMIGIVIGYILFNYSPFRYKYHGPNSKDMIQKIFKHNDKCYKLKPIVTICPSGISMR
jgi:hypothetical protein